MSEKIIRVSNEFEICQIWIKNSKSFIANNAHRVFIGSKSEQQIFKKAIKRATKKVEHLEEFIQLFYSSKLVDGQSIDNLPLVQAPSNFI